MLSCLHCFCRECLHREVGRQCSSQDNRGEGSQHSEQEGSQRGFNCPTCQRSVTIPVGGVKDIPQDLHLGNEVTIAQYQSKVASKDVVPCDVCIDSTSSGPAVGFCCSCHHFLCQQCCEYHKRARNFHQHDVIALGEAVPKERLSAVKPTCALHNKEFLFYCETCSCLICHDCTTTDHKDHKQNTKLASIASLCKDNISNLIDSAFEIMSQLHGAVDCNIRELNGVDENEETISQNIKQTFVLFHKMLDDRMNKVLRELHDIALSKKTALTLQKEQFETLNGDIFRCADVAQTVVEKYTDCEVIALKQLPYAELQDSVMLQSLQWLVPLLLIAHFGINFVAVVRTEMNKLHEHLEHKCMEQSEYDTLLAFCCDCKYPPECSKNEKDYIRRRAKNFIVKEGLLFYRDKHNKEYRVVTKKEKMKVLDGCHSAELGGGHFGRDKTLLKISERFYWIGMVNDVKEYCKTCEKCQKANGKFDKFSAELHPIPVKDEEWHTIGVDLIGPLPETQKGNKYIMTVSCLFSKWPEATALPDKTATGVAEFLFLCSQHMAVVNDELCRLCGIQCNMTSAYHPQSNGLDESERCDKPEDGLQQTITECNIKTMVDVRKKALENIMKAQGRQKNSKKLSKKGSKMEPNWTGPYLIHEVLSKGTYRLSKPNPPFQVLAQKYNMTRLKIFYQKVQVDVGVEDEEQQASNVQDQVDADDVDKQREETILPSLQKSSPLHTLKSVDKEDSTIQLGIPV
eukprot:Em0002g1609a